MTGRQSLGIIPVAALAFAAIAQGQAPLPRPIRNDRAQPARELLVLRHHQLRQGGHDEFYRLSEENVWPFFERNGARIVGQWKISQSAQTMTPGSDDVYRLVRYAGFDHWRATRSALSSGAGATGGADVALGGNGPAQSRSIGGYASRGELAGLPEHYRPRQQ